MDFYMIVSKEGLYFAGYQFSGSKMVPVWTDMKPPACHGMVAVYCQQDAVEAAAGLGDSAQVRPVTLPQVYG